MLTTEFSIAVALGAIATGRDTFMLIILKLSDIDDLGRNYFLRDFLWIDSAVNLLLCSLIGKYRFFLASLSWLMLLFSIFDFEAGRIWYVYHGAQGFWVVI